jgi:anaphase-promoting complex subunit 3
LLFIIFNGFIIDNYINLDPFSSAAKLNQTPDLASVLCLLGSLCKNVDEAAQYYVQCIKTNPFMWEAFENLCQMGIFTLVYQKFKKSGLKLIY